MHYFKCFFFFLLQEKDELALSLITIIGILISLAALLISFLSFILIK